MYMHMPEETHVIIRGYYNKEVIPMCVCASVLYHSSIERKQRNENKRNVCRRMLIVESLCVFCLLFLFIDEIKYLFFPFIRYNLRS